MVHSTKKLQWLGTVLLVLHFAQTYGVIHIGDRINHETVRQHPFMRFLMNPCGLTNLPPPSEMPANTPDFLLNWPMLDMVGNSVLVNRVLASETLRNLQHISEVLPSANPEFANEFRRVLQTLRSSVSDIRRRSNLPQCEGIELQTLLLPTLPLTETHPIRDMFKFLMLVDAHLHIMVRDHTDNDRICTNESRTIRHEYYRRDLGSLPGMFVQIRLSCEFTQVAINRLTGKLEAVLCMLLQIAPSPQLIPILESVAQHRLYRYSDCSLRQTRDCLVLSNLEHWLNSVFQVIQRSSNHPLNPTDL